HRVGATNIQQCMPDLPHDQGRRQSLGSEPPQYHRKESRFAPELRLFQRTRTGQIQWRCPWTRQALDEPGANRVDDTHEHNRHRSGRLLQRSHRGGRTVWPHSSPAFHFASGKISGASLPWWVQGSTVQSSLVLRSLITAVLCGPSVIRNRDTGAAIVWCCSNLS